MRLFAPQKTYRNQADATPSQANPVSTTLYTMLNTVVDARLIMIGVNITWAVTQPTPLEIVVTIDGVALTGAFTNPVSGTDYFVCIRPSVANAGFELTSATTEQRSRSFLLEGKSIKVEARITWAVTQPTPLNCRVKYARLA